MDCHSQHLELWQFLLPFKIYKSDYLKFNSKNIRVVVKSFKYNNFLLNSIQGVILKTQSSSLPSVFCQTVVVSINFYDKNYWNISVL